MKLKIMLISNHEKGFPIVIIDDKTFYMVSNEQADRLEIYKLSDYVNNKIVEFDAELISRDFKNDMICILPLLKDEFYKDLLQGE